jgi:hypothetical protein
MYLVDTNIWLERLLDQEQSQMVGQFLAATPSSELLVTDFAFHSIGVVLGRLGRARAFLRFVQDVFVDGSVQLASLGPYDMERLVSIMNDWRLDFDDAYQYVAAERYDAVIVSLDSDFDRTDRGRYIPGSVLP